jgi:NAD-dependent histone deacetylase SIR2
MESRASSDKEGPPPAKRRRISEKTERTTEYLDLRESGVSPGQQRQLDRVVNVLHKRQKIVVIAGAGISVSAGSMYSATRPTRRPLTRFQSPTSALLRACSEA